MTTLVAFDRATIVHTSQEVALDQFTWQVRDGEIWAIVGPTASGKSTLAETILGRHRLTAGTVEWPFIEALKQQGRQIKWPSDVIRLVSFKEESAQFSYGKHYCQQ